MSATLEALFQSALALPEAERIELIDRLSETLSRESESMLHPAWKAAVKRRGEELDLGKVRGIPWEEVRKRAWEAVAGDESKAHG
jgi:putative addiction module component (TIGR02574 family)